MCRESRPHNLISHRSARYTSVYVAYQMFRQLGLRHLAVLGMDGCLAGILTRKVPAMFDWWGSFFL